MRGPEPRRPSPRRGGTPPRSLSPQHVAHIERVQLNLSNPHHIRVYPDLTPLDLTVPLSPLSDPPKPLCIFVYPNTTPVHVLILIYTTDRGPPLSFTLIGISAPHA